jgi:hypothetical protein
MSDSDVLNIGTLNFNCLYISLSLLLLYNICNYDNITIVLSKIYSFNYMSLLIIINIIGLYIFLKNLTLEVNIKWSIKYK